MVKVAEKQRKAPKVRFYEWARSERPEKTTKHTVLVGNHWYSILFVVNFSSVYLKDKCF